MITCTVPPSTDHTRARDVGGALGREESIAAADLVAFGEAPDRALGPRGFERGLAAVVATVLGRLVEQAALVHPELRLHGTRARSR